MGSLPRGEFGQRLRLPKAEVNQAMIWGTANATMCFPGCQGRLPLPILVLVAVASGLSPMPWRPCVLAVLDRQARRLLPVSM